MRQYIGQRRPTYDELYLQACQQMIDLCAAVDGKPNPNNWFYKQLKENIEHYKSLAGTSHRAGAHCE